MDAFDGDSYIHGDVDGYGGGDPYGNVESTRDFLSQPYSSSGGYNGFNPSQYAYPGSSSVTAPRMGMAALDLNAQGEEWPPLGGFQALLRSGQPGGDADRSNGSPPVRARSARRTLGLRGSRSSGGGGVTTGPAISSISGGGHGASLPPVLAGVRGGRGSASGVADGSRTRGRRPQLPTPAVSEDNFEFDNPNATDNVEILPNDPMKNFT